MGRQFSSDRLDVGRARRLWQPARVGWPAPGRWRHGAASSELYGFATVKTDKDDYAPGELVTMTGSGWQPGGDG